MRHARWLIGSLVLTIFAAATADAQVLRSFHVSPYAGLFFFDDGTLSDVSGVEVETAAILGARVGYAFTRSWQIEGAYGFAPLTTEPSEFQGGGDPEELADIDAHLLYGAINYLLTYADNPTALLLAAGGGVMILDPDVEGADSTSDPMLELGVGFAHPVRDWITIRGDFRDHMVFCGAPELVGEPSACPAGDETLHNFEVSAALQFWLY
jgi:outer membrane beta-barrel protein